MISSTVDQGIMARMRVCKVASMVSRLFFAYDNVIFPKATKEDSEEILNILELYVKALG